MTVRDIIILGSSSQQPTRFRNHGAYLTRWNGKGLLFDPGEGTQRQFIFAGVAPTVVTHIFISHFHGDHCLGLGSMLMRLNLDKVKHTIHCYYPASGKKYFDRLRYGTIYHETIKVEEHPVHKSGVVEDNKDFKIEAFFLDHPVDNLGWRVTEPDTLKFDKKKLKEFGIEGSMVRQIKENGLIKIDDKTIKLENISWIRKGDTFSVISDTKYCQNAVETAKGAKILLCESTYLEEHEKHAEKYKHLTAKQAATIAKEANAKKLILTHFSARYATLKGFLKEGRAIFKNTETAEDLKVFKFPK